MDVNLFLPFISSAIMFAFVAAVLYRWTRRRHVYLLMWATGLTMFGIGSFAEAASVIGWNSTVFKFWYLFGAMLNAGWIGQGTVYLLAKRRVANVALAIIIGVSLIGIYGMTVLPLDGGAFSKEIALGEQYRAIMPEGAWVRAITPLFNFYGLLALIGGAIYSAWLFWRKRSHPDRMWGNILIAVGALSIGFASSLTRLGNGNFLYIGELIAAVFMFSGFLVASQQAKAPERASKLVTAPAN